MPSRTANVPCPGPVNRRTWLRIGGLSLGSLASGIHPSLSNLLAAGHTDSKVDQDFSVILFWANGGPSRLDRRVLFIFCGEFGRTPKIYNQDRSGRPGRDHWSRAMSVFLARGGLKMGQVIGATNSKSTLGRVGPPNVQESVGR